jgi:tRNA nucleotidyltransferase/poly(A) polymerase
MISTSISLTEEEDHLFKLVLDALRWQDKATTARVAGGWVRDKILGKESADIDITLDDQSGVDFAEGVNAYLASMGEQTESVGVILANPDQSKHLETANLRVLGFEIDCVNLRAETYAANSRIPEIRSGTPLEDAMRRDFTINSLFYNINTGAIEDFSERGLPDMNEGVLRTPLPPYQTFMDDPLRILRGIRFSCRLNYRLDDDILACAQMPEVQQALREKVSKERVLKEMEGMLSHAQACIPILAFSYMFKLGMFESLLCLPPIEKLSINEAYVNTPNALDTIFSFESRKPGVAASVEEAVENWKAVSIETLAWCNVLLSMTSLPQDASGKSTLCKQGALSDSEDGVGTIAAFQAASTPSAVLRNDRLKAMGSPGERIIYWAALTSALARLQVTEKKNKKAPLAGSLLKESLKMDAVTVKDVLAIHDTAEAFREAAYGISAESAARIATFAGGALDRNVLTEEEKALREKLGMIIHKGIKHLWTATVLYVCACDLAAISLQQDNGKLVCEYLYICVSHIGILQLILAGYLSLTEEKVKDSAAVLITNTTLFIYLHIYVCPCCIFYGRRASRDGRGSLRTGGRYAERAAQSRHREIQIVLGLCNRSPTR